MSPGGPPPKAAGGGGAGGAQVTQGAQKVQEAMNAIGDKKTQKGAKELKGMLAQIPYVGGLLSALPGIEAVLQPLLMILKPFEPFLKLIGGMLSQFMAGFLTPIMKALQPLFELFAKFMPIFGKIGEIIGKVIGVLIEALMPVFMALEPIFPILAKALGLLIMAGLIPLILAIYGIGIAIAALIDLFTFGSAHAIESWNNLMLPAIGAAFMAIPEILAAQEGAYIPATPGGMIVRVAEGGEGEHIIPGSQVDSLLYQQMETNNLLRGIYRDKIWRHRL